MKQLFFPGTCSFISDFPIRLWLKRLPVALTLAIISFNNSWAQTMVTITGAGVATNGPFDIADANYVGSGDIYPSTEINASGNITVLEWDNFSCPPSITIPVKIYLKLIPTTTSTWVTETYSTALTGATLVYSGNATFNNNNFANPITLQTPFYYTTANNLEVITEADYGSEDDNEPSWYYNSSLAKSDCSWYSSTSSGLPSASSSTGGIDQYRPAIRITIVPACSVPTITMGSNPTTCYSTSAQTVYLHYTATTDTPITYSISGWSGGGFANVANATLPSDLADSIGIAVPASVAGGAYSATVTVATACGGVSTNYTISVTITAPPATPGSISGPSTVCSNSTNTYSVTAVTGATSYSWILPIGWTGSSTTNSISATQGTGGGNITVVANGACGSSSPQTLAVTLGAAPATPGNISGPASLCNNSTNTYSITAVSGATSYTWTLPAGWTGSSTTNSINATEGTGGGTISVTANNACGSSGAQSTTITIAAAPATPGPITGPDSSCSNSVNTFSVAGVSGATSYTWSLPGTWTGSSTTNSISATTGSAAGNISVTANNSCGSSSAVTLAESIIVVPGVPASIIGPGSVCSGSNDIYSVVPVSGATSYTWTLPGGWTGTSATGSITALAGNTGGNVSVSAIGACGTSSAQTLAVSVTSTLASPASIIGPASVCNGTASIYSVLPVSGATTYTWTLPNGWTGTSATDSISATPNSLGGTITVTADNTCANSMAQTLAVTIGTVPATPGAITGPDSVCNGSQNTYSIATVNGATSYTWTLPSGWTGSSVSESISTTAGPAGGTISVTANSACGSSSAQTFVVNMGAGPPTPGVINGSTNVCSGSQNTYTIPGVTGATSYTWTLPNGWTGASASESINATSGHSGGTISVVANSACGSSAPQTLVVTSDAGPATPGSISGPDSICSGGQSTYSVASVSGATSYTWTLPNGWSGSSAIISIVATAGSGGGTISVTANDGCGSSSAQTLVVSLASGPPVPGSITGPATICNGVVSTYSVAPVAGATSYTWTLPNGWTGNSSIDSITATAGAVAGTVSVTANSGCGTSSAQTLTVSLGSAPGTPGSITGPDSLCSGSQGSYAVIPVNGITYTWILPNGWSGSSITNSVSATAGSSGGNVSVTAQNACGTSGPQTKSVIVSAAPQVTFTFSAGPVCNNQNPVVTLHGGSPVGGTYSGQGVTGSTFNASTLSVGNYEVTYTYLSPQGCEASDSANIAVTVCTGISNTQLPALEVYPNPFNDELIIKTKGNYTNGKAILMDVTGRELRMVELNEGLSEIQLNTSGMAKGAYLLNIMVDDKIVAVKKLFRIE